MDEFDPYTAWLHYAEHDRAPGYYALLGLTTFEADIQRIEQAFLQQLKKVSQFLDGPKRAQAQSILAELKFAQQRLTDPTSKADYDARLRSSPCACTEASSKKRAASSKDVSEAPVMLIEVGAEKPPVAEPPPRAAATEPVSKPLWLRRRPAQQASEAAATAAIEATWRTILSIRSTQNQPTKQEAALPATSALPAPLPIPTIPAKGRQRLLAAAAALLAALAIWGIHHSLKPDIAARQAQRRNPVLSGEEKLLIAEQMGVLYDSKQDTAVRAAAAEKLRALSPAAIQKYARRLNDLAEKQPEEEVRQTLRDVLQSAGTPP